MKSLLAAAAAAATLLAASAPAAPVAHGDAPKNIVETAQCRWQLQHAARRCSGRRARRPARGEAR